jgi:hypothetical protein
MTPEKGIISMAGKVWSAISVPSAASECVACKMNQVTAAVFIPVPNMDTRLAANRKRSPGLLRRERIALNLSLKERCYRRAVVLIIWAQDFGDVESGAVREENGCELEGALKLARKTATTGWIVCAATLLAFAAAEQLHNPHQPVDAACYEGKQVALTIAPARLFRHAAVVGPWQLGRAVRRKPADGRPNIYLVVPGKQNHLPGWDDFDHNLVLSGLPRDGAAEWDVYWALVLDPAFQQDLRGERELLLATQTEISPAQALEFDQIPAAGFLRKMLKIDSMAQLDGYRRKSGALPQVIIVPAGFAIQAAVVAEPQEQTAEAPKP